LATIPDVLIPLATPVKDTGEFAVAAVPAEAALEPEPDKTEFTAIDYSKNVIALTDIFGKRDPELY